MDPGPIDGASIAARYVAVEHIEPVKQKLKSAGENELGQHTDSNLRHGVSRHAGHSHKQEDPSDAGGEDADGPDVAIDEPGAQADEVGGGTHLDVMV